ncbi:hypothetical protein BDZ97DRAFT_1781368 [Flammula alnicola]|nr:hypothetical protein BDZ97DRAFT_1781368 [Flammula alnicola]
MTKTMRRTAGCWRRSPTGCFGTTARAGDVVREVWKYVSAAAEGSPLDMCDEYEVGMMKEE